MKTVLSIVVLMCTVAFAMPGDDTLFSILRQPQTQYQVGDTVFATLAGSSRAPYIAQYFAAIEIDSGRTFHCNLRGGAASPNRDTSLYQWVIPAKLGRLTSSNTADSIDLDGHSCSIKFVPFNDIALTVSTDVFTVSATSNVRIPPSQKLSKISSPGSSIEGTFSVSGRMVPGAVPSSGLYLQKTSAGAAKILR